MTPIRLTPDRRALADHPDHLRLAGTIARRYARRFPPLADEFAGAALLALCEAALAFDPGHGAKFPTFAAHRIVGAMLDVHRGENPYGYRRRGGGPRARSLGPVADGELAADLGPVGWELEYQDELEGLARRAGGRRGEVLRCLYGRAETTTQAALARSWGVDDWAVWRWHGQAVRVLAWASGRLG